jgi:hypothetical protein
MSYSLKKINGFKVKPIKVPTLKPDEIKGYNLIPLLHAAIFVCGKKGSGKTNVTFEILKECIDRYTNVIIFCSTNNADYNWLEIRKWLEKRKQPHTFYNSIVDDEGDNILDILMDKINVDKDMELEKKDGGKKGEMGVSIHTILDDAPGIAPKEPEAKKEKTNKKLKKKGPKYLLVFDDMTQDLRDNAKFRSLLKKMRHYDMKIIISSQYPTDLDPQCRVQIDFWMLFRGFPLNKMQEVFPQLDLNDITFKEFFEIYLGVTE